MPKRTRRKRLISDTRGAAMVEGVIVMPFFIIALAAVIHLHRSYSAKLDASVEVRSCAWQYAIAGCKRTQGEFAGCSFGSLATEGAQLDGLEDHAELQSEAQQAFGDGENGGAGFASALESANGIGLVLLGLREGTVARASREVTAPSLLGGRTRKISGDYSVMCNEKKMAISDIAKEAYCALDEQMNN
ncbi:MAG: hypothetical protein GY811_01855, partial [Myxococcales bacterium]|nr:hypothetical protein [Myxococcales bacterium]